MARIFLQSLGWLINLSDYAVILFLQIEVLLLGISFGFDLPLNQERVSLWQKIVHCIGLADSQLGRELFAISVAIAGFIIKLVSWVDLPAFLSIHAFTLFIIIKLRKTCF